MPLLIVSLISIFVGLLLVLNLCPRCLSATELMPVAYLIGLAFVPWFMIVLSLIGIPFTRISILVGSGLVCVLLTILLNRRGGFWESISHDDQVPFLEAIDFFGIRLTDKIRKIGELIILLLFVLVVGVLVFHASSFPSIFSPDGIKRVPQSLAFAQAKDIRIEAYPLHLLWHEEYSPGLYLLRSSIFIFDDSFSPQAGIIEESGKGIFPFFYAAIVIFMYARLRRRANPIVALLLSAILAGSQQLIFHAYSASMNLSSSAFFVTGVVMFGDWLRTQRRALDVDGRLVLSGALIGASAFFRFEIAAFFPVVLFLLSFVSRKRGVEVTGSLVGGLASLFVPFALVYFPWPLFRHLYWWDFIDLLAPESADLYLVLLNLMLFAGLVIRQYWPISMSAYHIVLCGLVILFMGSALLFAVRDRIPSAVLRRVLRLPGRLMPSFVWTLKGVYANLTDATWGWLRLLLFFVPFFLRDIVGDKDYLLAMLMSYLAFRFLLYWSTDSLGQRLLHSSPYGSGNRLMLSFFILLVIIVGNGIGRCWRRSSLMGG